MTTTGVWIIPASIHIGQSYYTLNCDMAVSGSVFKLWTQTKPNSFKLHVIIEVNEFKNKTFWMSISHLFVKGKFLLFYGGSFEGVDLEIKLQTNKKINNTHYRIWIWSRIRFYILNVKIPNLGSELHSPIGIVNLFEGLSSYSSTSSFKTPTRK